MAGAGGQHRDKIGGGYGKKAGTRDFGKLIFASDGGRRTDSSSAKQLNDAAGFSRACAADADVVQ